MDTSSQYGIKDFSEAYEKHKEVIDSYQIQGFLLKQISEEIKPHLSGVLEGVVVETRTNATALVFLVDDSEEGKTRLKPWMTWKEGSFTETKGRRVLVEPVVPPSKKTGVYVMKTGRIAVPLLC